jgi:hypothetical protein
LEPKRAKWRPVKPVPTTRSFSALSAWGLAAALALGVTLGSLVSARWSSIGFSALPPRANGNVIIPAADDEEPRFTPAERKLLAGTHTAACTRHQPSRAPRYTVGQPQVLGTADLGDLACCTECHNANSDSVSSYATVAVSQSCGICHKGTSDLLLE